MLEINVANKGAELTSIQFNNKEMLHDGRSFWNRQAPVLFPIVGRLKDNKTIINNATYEMSQHGFARDMNFNCINDNNNEKVYMLKSNNNTLKMYPFEFELYTTYVIENDTLTVKYKVVNKDDQEMIFGIGAHPGIKIDLNQEDYYFELEREEDNIEFMEVEGNYISDYPAKNLLENKKIIDITKESFINDAIIIKNFKSKKITLKQKRDNKKIVEFNISNFPILGIWSKPNAPYICVEPWYNTADRVTSTGYLKDKEGIIKLQPNNIFECEYSMKFF